MPDIPICALPQPDGSRCTDPVAPDPEMPNRWLSRCGNHLGMPVTSGEEDGAFAAQNPSHQPAGQVRSALIDTVEASFVRMIDRGQVEISGKVTVRRMATVIVDDLTAETLGRMLAGMAMGQVQP